MRQTLAVRLHLREASAGSGVRVPLVGVDEQGHAPVVRFQAVHQRAGKVARDVDVLLLGDRGVSGEVDQCGDGALAAVPCLQDRHDVVRVRPAAAIDGASFRWGGGCVQAGRTAVCGGLKGGAHGLAAKVRRVFRRDAAPQALEVRAGVAVRAGHEDGAFRYREAAGDHAADAGDVPVGHAYEVKDDECDGGLSVAEDEGAGEQVVVDAAGGAAQVAVVAAQVEAVLQVLGEGGDGEGGGSGEEGGRGHGSAQYSREALRPCSR